MRIFKRGIDFDDDLIRIAGEMLNIEASSLMFINGKQTDRADVPSELYKGYPRYVVNDITHIIRAAEGYIYISKGADVEGFEAKIMAAIIEMEKKYFAMDMVTGKSDDHMGSFHTVEYHFHTNIKVKSGLRLTRGSQNAGTTNIKRQFKTKPSSKFDNVSRFTWKIINIDDFDFGINNSNIYDAVGSRLCSIFYDTDNICKYGDNTVTQEFYKSDFVGHDNIIDTELPIILSSYYNAVCLEINNYWNIHIPDFRPATVFRNITPNKTYKRDFKDCEIKPKKISELSAEVSKDICSYCCSTLYDENYVLYGNTHNPDSRLGVAICPLCLHHRDGDKEIENKYLYVFRVRFPRTIESMVSMPNFSEVKKDIMLEALKQITPKISHIDGVKKFEYVLIGDKYLGIKNIDDYLFSDLSSTNKRKVCILRGMQFLK